MAERILPDLYRIEIPLPGNPQMAVNSYLVKGNDRFLLIDTGWNRSDCLRVMLSELNSLEVDLRKTDFLVTHVHPDHLGLTQSLVTDMSKIYFSYGDAHLIRREVSETDEERTKLGDIYIANGFPEGELREYMESHPAHCYGLSHHVDVSILREGDFLQVGDYRFTCVETPGHSMGHICLYEASRKILLAGDHILFDISPLVIFRLLMQDSLTQYLASLKKVSCLDVGLVLPGHRRIFSDHRRRIRELQEHHRDRLDEILSVLKEGDKTAFQVVPYLTWDIDCSTWERFSSMQKWFAFGETFAHLRYLKDGGMVREVKNEGKTFFSLM